MCRTFCAELSTPSFHHSCNICFSVPKIPGQKMPPAFSARNLLEAKRKGLLNFSDGLRYLCNPSGDHRDILLRIPLKDSQQKSEASVAPRIHRRSSIVLFYLKGFFGPGACTCSGMFSFVHNRKVGGEY